MAIPLLGSIGRGLLSAGKAIGRTGIGAGRIGVDSLRGTPGFMGKAMTAGFVGLPILGSIPFIGPALRKHLPGGKFLAHDFVGTSTPGATARYGETRRLAAEAAARNPLPIRTGGPTNRGLGNPTRKKRMKTDAYGNPIQSVKAAHALKEKIASPLAALSRITPMQALALGAGASAGTALGSHFLSGALNKMDSLRRDATRQTNLNKTMRVLDAVNPEVQDSPQIRAKAAALFNIVHRTSPYVAREPVVAASVINTMLASPSDLPTPDSFKALAELQSKLESASAVRPMKVPLSPNLIAGALAGTDG
jgi:hypothetical protein